MKIAILGSGGREHALTFSISKSNIIEKIYCIPGNAGTSSLAENISIDINNFEKVYDFLKKNNIDFVVVGPEEPLVNGIVDYLEKLNIKVFGPNKLASQLEGSKIFTKNLCKKYNIPTAEFGVFKNAKESYNYIDNAKHPLVIKADNLAAGKGVYICRKKKESYLAVKEIFEGKFGTAKNILFEEFLEGEEMSYFIVSDGKTFKYFGSAQDHKRVGEGDKGKNTGGMGAYSPSRLFNKELEQKILEKIIKPTLKGINDLGTKYKGFLYAGLMIVKDEPFLIEYNVRMGDPECQTILPTLDTDIIKIFQSCINEKLDEIEIKWINRKSLCVVLCSNGYPDKYEKNIIIDNFEKLNLDENNYLFHAGTEIKHNKIYAVGGRVLNFISLSNTYSEAKKNIHENLEKLNWEKGFFRKDIGYKVINK
ncbi:phosphoribosylamine--glycine ligase [Candidatus Pelagibacter communis]|uniref:phosphoribosylamine--glycine ligase n=1 Tax=Pelagibacter ubique TaxID=198252 RepID=UPI00065B43F0|nr:phosphoribosylamine--glycine ligase [Candidatus Pelagibacter ubique]